MKDLVVIAILLAVIGLIWWRDSQEELFKNWKDFISDRMNQKK